VLPTLGPVDHVITDPPYSEQTHAGARFGGSGGNEGRIDFDSVGAEGVRYVFQLAAPARWTVATIDWRHMLPLEECPPVGSRFVRFGIWIKPDGAPQFTGDRPATGWEAVAILHADGGRMRWNRGGHHAVWIYNIVRGEHPTEKPLPLIRDFVRSFTDPGDLVLDPFMGSGTTLAAAQIEGRRAIGIEMEERYCEIAANRLRHGTKGAALVARGQLPFEVTP
jgi:site-specific DNA-methyltransferase (adenine-specific)